MCGCWAGLVQRGADRLAAVGDALHGVGVGQAGDHLVDELDRELGVLEAGVRLDAIVEGVDEEG